jgi:uncharacterized protein YndB with AHSA1/START domain
MEPQPLEAVLVRRFPHPVSRVFRVWSDPIHVAAWFRPYDDVTLQVTAFDFREGGDYFFRYTWTEGVFPVCGKFLTIRPEDCLIFSWLPQPPDMDAGKESLVSVWFRSLAAASTEIELRHTLFPDEAMRRRHEDGWVATLDRLCRYLVPDQTKPQAIEPPTS